MIYGSWFPSGHAHQSAVATKTYVSTVSKKQNPTHSHTHTWHPRWRTTQKEKKKMKLKLKGCRRWSKPCGLSQWTWQQRVLWCSCPLPTWLQQNSQNQYLWESRTAPWTQNFLLITAKTTHPWTMFLTYKEWKGRDQKNKCFILFWFDKKSRLGGLKCSHFSKVLNFA